MDYGQDFNDIISNDEKKEGRRRQENNINDFRYFIADIKYKGEPFTLANKREDEGFIQERLDRFFGFANWKLKWDTGDVSHTLRQSSDHSMIILDTKQQRKKTKARFIFDSKRTKMQDWEEMIKKTWNRTVNGSRMFRVHQKLKWHKLEYIK